MSAHKDHWGVHCILLVIGLIVVFPFIWSISLSFERLYTNSLPIPPNLFPKTPTLFNYMVAFNNVKLVKYTINTFIIAITGTAAKLVIDTIAAFAFSKGTFRFKNILLLFLLTTMMIPGEVRIIEMFNVIKAMGLVNTYTAAMLPSAICGGFTIFFIKTYVDTLPDSLLESAVIEGASLFTTYRAIFLPLMSAVLISQGILSFIGYWNDFLWPLVALGSEDKRTLTLAMATFQSAASAQIHPGVAMAVSVVSAAPLLIPFLVLQKHIVRGIAFSGIKE